MKKNQIHKHWFPGIGLVLASLFLILGTSLQVPIAEAITHEHHHTNHENYAYFAELEESNEEVRSSYLSIDDFKNEVVFHYLKSMLYDGYSFQASKSSEAIALVQATVYPPEPKKYLLTGRINSQVPSIYNL